MPSLISYAKHIYGVDIPPPASPRARYELKVLGGGGGLTFLVVERMTDVQIKGGNVAQSAAGAPSHVDRSKVVGLLAVTKARKEEGEK